MKRYLLFGGSTYYPEGGWADFRGAFDSIEEAVDYVLTLSKYYREWWHVIDTHTMKLVRHEGYNE